MARIIVDPLTRIEGHARVEIDIDDNYQVKESIFKVMDFRGWETFTRGTQVEMMPTIMPRICGTCSVSHHLASAKAVDQIFGVTPPPAAQLLRQALNLAGYIHSHGIHIFLMAYPDLLLGLDADYKKRNLLGLEEQDADLIKKALELRQISTFVTEKLGGRGIHPVAAVAGGMAMPLDQNTRASLQKQSEEGIELAKALLDKFKVQVISQFEDQRFPKLELPTHYLSLVNEGTLDFYQGNLRLRAPDCSQFEFPEDQWENYLSEKTAPHSYAKSVFCSTENGEEVPYRVGPLARLNCCDQIDTPLANTELQTFRQIGGFPCHQTVLYHYARLIELLYATEKLQQLFEQDEICSKEVRTPPAGQFQQDQHGTGIVEAPRGTLIHKYQVDDNGIVTDVNLLVATQQNISSINDTIGQSVEEAYLGQQPDDNLLLNSIEFGVRCYDPCLSCATHRIGEMKLDVVIRRQGEVIRTARR